MTHCARCDFAGSPDDLAQHAADSGHPLCPVCLRSLSEAEPAVCARCRDYFRSTLGTIAVLYDELPDHLGHLHGQPLDRRHGDDRHPLPGGSVLTMLGPGSDGTAARRLTSKERATGVAGREHGGDNQDTDGVSVAWVLCSWANDWRDERGDERIEMTRQRAIVTEAIRYLDSRATWAANCHPAFPDCYSEVIGLMLRLEAVTGRLDRAVRAPVACFGCGEAALERRYQDDGLEDSWTCRACRQTYTPERYHLALSAYLEQASRTG